MEIFIDESGYTGEDLVNLQQPIFVLASTCLPKNIAEKLLAEYFAKSKATELKHSVLGSRPSDQNNIVRFLQALNQQALGGATFVVHKGYDLVTNIVDWWIEPAMRKDGIDLYDRGANIGLANLIYSILKSLLPDDSFRQHLVRFQHMMRSRTLRSYKEFWNPIYKTFYDEPEGPVKDTLVFLIGGERLGFQHLLSLPKHSMDLALTCALQLVQHWRDTTEDPLVIIHDRSSSMAREKWIWETLVTAELPRVEVGYDRRKMRFPLNVKTTELASSKNYPQLQIADLLAGSTATFSKSKLQAAVRSHYGQALEETGIEKFIIGGIWPSTDVDPESLETLGENTGNLVEFVATLLSEKKLQPVNKK